MEEKVLFDAVYAPCCFQSQNTPLTVGRRYQVVDIVDSPDHWGLQVRLKGYPNDLFPKEFFKNAREYKFARITHPWIETAEEIEKILKSRIPLYNYETLEEGPDGAPFWKPQRSSLVPMLEIHTVGFGYYVIVTRNNVFFVKTR